MQKPNKKKKMSVIIPIQFEQFPDNYTTEKLQNMSFVHAAAQFKAVYKTVFCTMDLLFNNFPCKSLHS